MLEYNALQQAGLALSPLSLSMFAVALLAGKKQGKRRPSSVVRLGFALCALGILLLILVVPQRVPESYVRSTVTARIEDRLRAIREQVMSRTRLERVILEFNLYAEARKTGTMQETSCYFS